MQNCSLEKTTSLNVQIVFDSIIEMDELKHLPRQLKYKPSIRNNMRSVVEDAYRWLAENYNPGDQIYLFGFSWGAYEVRALAGIIYEVGLIRRDSNPTKEQISGVYDLYELNRSQPSSQTRKNASQFKHDKCWHDLRVHFVGVWDTLSPTERREGAVPPISSPMHACHFRHALALDEGRGLYPEYLQGTMFSNVKDSNDVDTCDVKEVWNMPLLWMHREASEKGLILKPLDLDFLPNDCYFLPQQVMRSRHSSQPRHILPGQKVHTTVLLQMRYMGRNTLVVRIPSMQCLDTNLDNEIWEPELFSDTVARQLIDKLGKERISYSRRLLYMLQFKQGKECVKRVPNCRETLKSIIQARLEDSKTWRVDEFAVCFAYWVASPELVDSIVYEEETDSLSPTDLMEREWILGVLRQALEEDFDSRELFFFPPLIRDETLIRRLDGDSPISSNYGVNFGYWTEVVADLVVCEHYQEIVLDELKIKRSGSSRSRLSWMLHASAFRDRAAALRIVQALSRTPQGWRAGTKMCTAVKFRLHRLAETDGCIGALAAEALISLRVTEEVQNETEKGKQRIESLFTSRLIDPVVQFCKNHRYPKIRAGLLLAFNHWNMVNSQDPSFAKCDTSHWVFDHLFATKALSDTEEGLLDILLLSANSRVKAQRTTATFTLLKLCENAHIRIWLLKREILEIFVGQLKCHDSSLLAAYALLVCCKHDNLKSSIIKNPRVSKYIVKMLRLDYFNDWLGQVEGFQILGEFMKDDELRGKLKEYDVLEVLASKLYAFRRKDAWRKLGYPQSNPLRIFEKNANWIDELVSRALEKLELKQWSTQKVGVAVLAALAQTEYGVDTIKGRIHDIVKILLDASNENLKLRAILGPACALRILSENSNLIKAITSETLREHIRDITQYIAWKETYLPHKDIYKGWVSNIFGWAPCGRPKEHRNKAPWHVKTPTLGMIYSLHSLHIPGPGGLQLNDSQGDVQTMLNEAIKAIDEEFSDGELPPIEEILPPHIEHWSPLLIDASIVIGSGFALSIAWWSAVTAATIACSPLICVTGAGIVIADRLHRRDQDDGEDRIQDEGDSAI
ncbi:hypothetical protein J3R83DRAFT_12506 [Lanmaoa asiatica]|nr:hypothetical protein J3R83DRAFT_12506 [Lanmaoa asiatica]